MLSSSKRPSPTERDDAPTAQQAAVGGANHAAADRGAANHRSAQAGPGPAAHAGAHDAPSVSLTSDVQDVFLVGSGAVVAPQSQPVLAAPTNLPPTGVDADREDAVMGISEGSDSKHPDALVPKQLIKAGVRGHARRNPAPRAREDAGLESGEQQGAARAAGGDSAAQPALRPAGKTPSAARRPRQTPATTREAASSASSTRSLHGAASTEPTSAPSRCPLPKRARDEDEDTTPSRRPRPAPAATTPAVGGCFVVPLRPPSDPEFSAELMRRGKPGVHAIVARFFCEQLPAQWRPDWREREMMQPPTEFEDTTPWSRAGLVSSSDAALSVERKRAIACALPSRASQIRAQKGASSGERPNSRAQEMLLADSEGAEGTKSSSVPVPARAAAAAAARARAPAPVVADSATIPVERPLSAAGGAAPLRRGADLVPALVEQVDEEQHALPKSSQLPQ